MQQYLITVEEVSNLSRSISIHLDEKDIEVYIRESENIDMKNALGDELLIDIKKNPDKYNILLNGGEYESECKGKRTIVGL